MSFYVKTIGNGQTAGSGGTNNRFGIHGSAEWENESGGTRTEYPLCHFANFGITGKRVSLTQKLIPPAGYTKLKYLSFALQLTRKPAADNNETWIFENPKLEMGSKATDYSEADEDFNETISALGEDLQDQIDGKIESYNQTTNPADTWTTTVIKTQHTGDIWYDDSTKLTQRWSGTAWMPLKDADAIAAQNLAQQKKRVFTATPTTPYDVGDLWVQGGTGDIMKCKTALASGSYNAAHWEKASKYTDDTTANQAVSNTVLTPADKISLYATFLSIQNEYSRLKEQCTNLGVTDTLKTSYDALYAVLNGIVGTTALQNATTTGFNKSNYDTLYKNYVTARESLEQAQITKVYEYTNTIKEHFTTDKALAVANWFASQDKTMIDGAYIYTGTVTAKQIAANSIGTGHLVVGMNPNLVRYGLDTMEQFSTVPYYLSTSGTTITLDSTQCYCGTKSIKVSGTTSNNYICLGNSTNDFGCVPVTAGKKYIISCYVRHTTTSRANVTFNIVGHTEISSNATTPTASFSDIVTNTDDWKRLIIKYTATSTYPYISLRIATGSSNIPVWFDAFQIEEVDDLGKEPGAFKQAGTTIIDGGNITTGIVKSVNYKYSSGNFADAGTMIDLATGVIRSKGFGIDASGNSYFNGTVTATTLTATTGGKIAGWNIKSSCLWKGSSALGSTGKTNIYLGDEGISFSDKFIYSTSTGELEINGKILASSGYIGDKVSGFTIGSKAIYNGMSYLASTATGIYLGTDGISLGGGKIKATSDGKFYAKDADISGNIKLDGGLNLLTYNDVTKTNFYQKVLYTNIDKTGAAHDAVFCDANLYLKGGALNVGDSINGISYELGSATSDALAGTLARRDGYSDINVRLIRSIYQYDNYCNGGIAFRTASGSGDNYIRFCNNPTSIRNFIGASASNHTHTAAQVGAAASSHQHGQLHQDGTAVVTTSNAGTIFRASEARGDNKVTLGSSNYRWVRLWAAQGTISTSDKNDKINFTAFDYRYENMFMDIIPGMFQYKNFTVNDQHDRMHCGIMAQDLEYALHKNNLSAELFAALCRDDLEIPTPDGRTYRYGINYSELHGLEIHMIQKTILRVNVQEQTMQELKEENIVLRNNNEELTERLDKLEKIVGSL